MNVDIDFLKVKICNKSVLKRKKAHKRLKKNALCPNRTVEISKHISCTRKQTNNEGTETIDAK